MKITLEFETVLSEREVRSILQDALFEFDINRGPTAESYVYMRYPGGSVYSPEEKLQKIQQVYSRKKCSRDIHNSVCDAAIES